MKESIESKLISVCLINDYSLIAQLHIFVYERAELSSISLECTKVKGSILNNFVSKNSNNISTIYSSVINIAVQKIPFHFNHGQVKICEFEHFV